MAVTQLISFQSVHALVPAQSIDQVRSDLRAYGLRFGVPGLETRIFTGLDPVGVLAVAETRARLERIAVPLRTSLTAVTRLTHDLLRGLPFKSTASLYEDHSPEELVWMIAASITQSGQRLDPIGFLHDYWRLNRKLEAAALYPQLAAERALASLLLSLRGEVRPPRESTPDL